MNEEVTSTLSQKVQDIAKSPKYRGAIFQIEADEKGLALVDVKEASLKVYLMIDPDCDKILETRFFTYGGPVFTALADTFCKKIQMETIDEACKITAESIEEELRDIPEVRAIPENAPEISQMNKLIAKVLEEYPEKKATAIIVREKMERIKYRTQTAEGRAEADTEWNALTKVQKIEKIEEWLHKSVRGTLQGDGGDLEILDLTEDNHLKIRFQGACAGCGSAMGGTLFYIEDELQNNVYYNLIVDPEDPLDNMNQEVVIGGEPSET
ncbi:NifU family protein [Fibrobacter sp. UWEL]|uniref:NifU family protein n=1 Tax=Fibrobacter sp. UWEL TaxID=1896209 RepID=UPI000920E264|nr:NifU family protein [Fibrobacter sp. UWEL]SHK37606.1 NifU-like protein [Fibrobacter sp. UWEL]